MHLLQLYGEPRHRIPADRGQFRHPAQAECEGCGRRFTTYEKIDTVPLMVIKKDKSRQPLNSSKLRSGIIKACEKRPVSLGEIDKLVREIEMKA
jgi:transcriptional regulator NrdR family protein